MRRQIRFASTRILFLLLRYTTLFAVVFMMIGLYKTLDSAISRIIELDDDISPVETKTTTTTTTTPTTTTTTTTPAPAPDLDASWDPSKPKLILILGYQRVSSSFISQLLNLNPQAFHLFEPMDGMYVDMYGTAPGWNVPTDIYFYPNMTRREMPEYEKEFVQSSLSTIFTCNFSAASAGMLTTHYLHMFSEYNKKAAKYSTCIRRTGVYRGYAYCRKHIAKHCPQRFNGVLSESPRCFTGQRNATNVPNGTTFNGTSRVNQDFAEHHACKEKYRTLLNQKCVKFLEKQCLESPIRATKTVRMTMETAGRLMKQHPNVKVIHLIRDPKSVALSRMYNPSFRGVNAQGDYVSEASMYCQGILKDLQERRRLEHVFHKSRFLQVFSDEFVRNTKAGTKELYDFIGETIPLQVQTYVEKYTKVVQTNSTSDHSDNNSTIIGDDENHGNHAANDAAKDGREDDGDGDAAADEYKPKWHSKFKFETAWKIDKACNELYQTLRPPWRSLYV